MTGPNHPSADPGRGEGDRDVFIHDLKNVMTGVLGHLSLARKRAGPESGIGETLDTAENILRGACRMAEDILRPTAASAPREELSVIDLVSGCAGVCVPPEGCELRIRYGSNVPMVRANPDKLRQVFNNLLTNAVHATGGRGRIEIEVDRLRPDRRRTDPRVLRVTVEDNGPGVAEEVRETLFEPGVTTRPGGSGLGLSTAREWLEAVGGSIGLLQPVSGRGARFFVDLPGSEATDPRSLPPSVPGVGEAGRALVLEDDPMVRSILCELLTHLGYDPVATSDGGETIERFREAKEAGEPFPLAILDLNVPRGMGGVATAGELRRIDPGARLFISSGQNAGPFMTDPAGHGFDGSLHKPYNLEQLAVALKG